MGTLRLLPKQVSRLGNINPYVTDRSLPAFYMSDYSVLGLLVSNHHEATRILEENGFSVIKKPGSVKVVINNPAHIQEMFRILTRHGIDPDVEIADIVDQVYQG